MLSVCVCSAGTGLNSCSRSLVRPPRHLRLHTCHTWPSSVNSPASCSNQTRELCKCCPLQASTCVFTRSEFSLFLVFFPCRFSYLQKHTADCIVDLRKECWQPLAYYRASLLAVADVEDATSCTSSDKRPPMANRHSSKQKSEGILQKNRNIYPSHSWFSKNIPSGF